ncbi:MAG: esterase/lipase family protein [Rudaea sp.]
MSKRIPVSASDLRGYGRLAVEATIGITQLVENLHRNIQRTPGVLAEPTQAPTKGITGLVYRSIRGVTRLVAGGIDVALAQLASRLGQSGESSGQREAILAALNGVLGDHLAASANPLAIPMQLRSAGRALTLTKDGLAAAIPKPSGKILLLVHGLCMNDLQWRRNAHDHGAALAADGGYTPLYLHYNSGVHILSNGRAFAELIEKLLPVWPVPVRELVIIGHSMGGLVSRSACHYAQSVRHDWLRHLHKLVFLGTPHQGAPLERAGNWVDAILGKSPYTAAFARLGKIRSAGITDLRHGSVLDADWIDRDRFARGQRKPAFVPLPQGVQCYAIAASIAAKSSALRARILGDGLVPLSSALGQHANRQRCLAFPKAQQWVGYRMNHLDLLERKEVYAKLREWLIVNPGVHALRRGKG